MDVNLILQNSLAGGVIVMEGVISGIKPFENFKECLIASLAEVCFYKDFIATCSHANTLQWSKAVVLSLI